MLTDSDFQFWCQENQLSEKAIALIQNIRKSPPARNVGGGENNVTGTYPSRKMKLSIQFESHTLELCGIYLMEHDHDVLEFYDQPSVMKLNYTTGGRGRGHNYTPDFFVITSKGAFWVQWKYEDELVNLSVKSPHLYCQDESGIWKCPPADQFAEQFGLNHTVLCEKDLNRVFLRNLKFLEDYLLDDVERVTGECLSEIVSLVTENPGISVKSLLEHRQSFTADNLYELIALEKIFLDINNQVIAEPEYTNLYVSRTAAEAQGYFSLSEVTLNGAQSITVGIGTIFIWNEQRWTVVECNEQTITLATPTDAVPLPFQYFMTMVSDGRAKIYATTDMQARNDNPGYKRFLQASERDLATANFRYVQLQKYSKGEPVNTPDRTIRDWLKKERQAEKGLGNGYLGLLPNEDRKGNRSRKLPERSIALMDEVIKDHYLTKTKPKALECWGILDIRCSQESTITPSMPTFYQTIKELSRYETALAREGSRAAYRHQEFVWLLDLNTPRHGDRPFEIVHIDHTECDIELQSRRGIKLGRPYVTYAVDAFTRRILAFHLSFERPSYRSCMMVIRELVRRHSRRPHIILVDNGKEFHSTYFETLVNMYTISKHHRPATKSRVGSVCERLFGTTNTQFFYNLMGNSQPTKNVRLVTKSVNPRNNSLWTLPELHQRLSQYVYQVYDTRIHSALGRSPRDEFTYSLNETGYRPQNLIAYDAVFIFSTMPTTRKGTATVDNVSGVKINYLQYWHNEFRSSKLQGKQVNVRFDPWDAGIAYAFVDSRWIELRSDCYEVFKGRAVKEVEMATQELRRRNSLRGVNLTITAKQIAEFLLEVKDQEEWMLVRERAAENKFVHDIVEGKVNFDSESGTQNFFAETAASRNNIAEQSPDVTEHNFNDGGTDSGMEIDDAGFDVEELDEYEEM